MDNEFDFSNSYLDYGKIANSPNMLAVTRLLASQLMTESYITVGEFLTKLADSDLKLLVELTDQEDHDHMGDFILMAEMLATGEGCDTSKATEQYSDRTKQFVTFVILESLYRKGLVELKHENLSFHSDMDNKEIVRLKEQ